MRGALVRAETPRHMRRSRCCTCLTLPHNGVRAGSHLQVLQDGRFKAPEELARVFEGAGVDPGKPIVASCGTGVTASVLALALHQLSPASQVQTGTLCSVFPDHWLHQC